MLTPGRLALKPILVCAHKANARDQTVSFSAAGGISAGQSFFTPILTGGDVRLASRSAAARFSRYRSIEVSHHQFGAVGASEVLPSGAGNSFALIFRFTVCRDQLIPFCGPKSRWKRIFGTGRDIGGLRLATKRAPHAQIKLKSRAPSCDETTAVMRATVLRFCRFPD